MVSEDIITSFEMTGCREILKRSTGAFRIERQVIAIENAIKAQNAGTAIDFAKTIVETVCKTILLDRELSITTSEKSKKTLDMPALIRKTCQCLQLTPENLHEDKDVIDVAVKNIMGGLCTTVTGLAKLRDVTGLIGHGHDAYKPTLDMMHGLMAAQAADSIVHFLHQAHTSHTVDPRVHRVRYDEQDSFNIFVDLEHGSRMSIFDARVRPSQILFACDEPNYRERLHAFADSHFDPDVHAQKIERFNEWLDETGDVIEINGATYQASEILPIIDPTAYQTAFSDYYTELSGGETTS